MLYFLLFFIFSQCNVYASNITDGDWRLLAESLLSLDDTQQPNVKSQRIDIEDSLIQQVKNVHAQVELRGYAYAGIMTSNQRYIKRKNAAKEFFENLEKKYEDKFFSVVIKNLQPNSDVERCIRSIWFHYESQIQKDYNYASKNELKKGLQAFIKGKIWQYKYLQKRKLSNSNSLQSS